MPNPVLQRTGYRPPLSFASFCNNNLIGESKITIGSGITSRALFRQTELLAAQQDPRVGDETIPFGQEPPARL